MWYAAEMDNATLTRLKSALEGLDSEAQAEALRILLSNDGCVVTETKEGSVFNLSCAPSGVLQELARFVQSKQQPQQTKTQAPQRQAQSSSSKPGPK